MMSRISEFWAIKLSKAEKDDKKKKKKKRKRRRREVGRRNIK